MLWRSHVLIGAFLAGAVFWALGFGIVETLLFALVGALSALVPDLDHESSKGRRTLDAGFILFAFLVVYLGGCDGTLCLPAISEIGRMVLFFCALVGGYFIVFILFKPRHRGITHTLAAGLVFGVLLFLVSGFDIALAGFIGYFSHLAADLQIRLV